MQKVKRELDPGSFNLSNRGIFDQTKRGSSLKPPCEEKSVFCVVILVGFGIISLFSDTVLQFIQRKKYVDSV